jgi:tetratricopeptide (TPR) repeat protein
MKHAKKNHAMISAAVLAIVAATAVACGRPSDATPATTSTPGNSGQDALTDSSQVTSLIQAGLTQIDKKNWSAAATSFQQALAINPGNIYANYDLGVIAQTTGQSSAAISYYKKVLAVNAAYTPAMYNEAILLESSHPQQAIAMYQKIVKINPRAATAYLRLALVQAEQGNITDAKENDAKAVAIDPALSKYKLPVKS